MAKAAVVNVVKLETLAIRSNHAVWLPSDKRFLQPMSASSAMVRQSFATSLEIIYGRRSNGS